MQGRGILMTLTDLPPTRGLATSVAIVLAGIVVALAADPTEAIAFSIIAGRRSKLGFMLVSRLAVADRFSSAADPG